MELLVVLFIIIAILGALAGGRSFGETLNKGCGCLLLIILALIGLGVIALMLSEPTDIKHSLREHAINQSDAKETEGAPLNTERPNPGPVPKE